MRKKTQKMYKAHDHMTKKKKKQQHDEEKKIYFTILNTIQTVIST